MWKICCGEPRNLANWPTEFGKICRGKLWPLLIKNNFVQICLYLTYHAALIALDISRCILLQR